MAYSEPRITEDDQPRNSELEIARYTEGIQLDAEQRITEDGQPRSTAAGADRYIESYSAPSAPDGGGRPRFADYRRVRPADDDLADDELEAILVALLVA